MITTDILPTHLNISINPEQDKEVIALSLSLAHVGNEQHTPSSSCCASREPETGLRVKDVERTKDNLYYQHGSFY